MVPGAEPNLMCTGSQVSPSVAPSASLLVGDLTRTEVADATGLEALYFRTLSVRPPAMLNLRVSVVALAEQPPITPATAPFPFL